MDSSTSSFWISSFSVVGESEYYLFFVLIFLQYFIAIDVLNANSVNPIQTPRSATSDLSLHCFSMSLFGDAKHKRVKGSIFLKKRHFFSKKGLIH